MKKAELKALDEMATHFVTTDPTGPLGVILRSCVTEIKRRRRQLIVLRKACEGVPQTLEQSASIIETELGDDDNEADGVREMAANLRKALGMPPAA